MSTTLSLTADRAGIAQAAKLLAEGATVAFPTETVYGLGADATNSIAVAQIYEAKGRPSFNPLIAHVADLEMAERLVDWNETAQALAKTFWPGPLTLVLPLRAGHGISPLVTAGLDTLAVRVPHHPIAQQLLAETGVPVAAPSANPSGRVSPTTPEHVLAGLDGRIGAILDGGPCAVGVESTILAMPVEGPPQLLRAGGLALEQIARVLGVTPQAASGSQITSPGQLASHYAPLASLELNVTAPRPGIFHLGFGPGDADLHLSRSGDLTEAAVRLFACLHQMDADGVTQATVAPIPEVGLGLALNDRLRRAATPRS